MPSAHLQPHDYRPDLYPTVLETLSSSDSDDRATLADLMKGKTRGLELLAREGESGAPKPALVVPRSRGQLCVREELATMSGNQSGGFSLTLSFCCLTSLPLIAALVLCLSIGEWLRRAGGAGSQPSEGVPVGEPITPLFNGSKVLPFARLLHEDRAAGVSPESSDSLLEEIAASPSLRVQSW